MERVNSVRGDPPRGLVEGPAHRLPLTGGDSKKVIERIRKSKGAATDIATPINACVDLTKKTTDELLTAFDTLEKVQRTLGEFFEANADFAERGVNPREAFAASPTMRDRYRVLTASAAHLYQAFAADALHRRTAERITGVRLADLGEGIVTAIEVLEYAPGGRK